jgi:hypothetical protein
MGWWVRVTAECLFGWWPFGQWSDSEEGQCLAARMSDSLISILPLGLDVHAVFFFFCENNSYEE